MFAEAEAWFQQSLSLAATEEEGEVTEAHARAFVDAAQSAVGNAIIELQCVHVKVTKSKRILNYVNVFFSQF